MEGVTQRVPTPTALETAVHDFLAREYPTFKTSDAGQRYAVVPYRDLVALGHGLDPESSKPRAHVSIDPGIKGGEPCIAGTRLTAEWMAEHVWSGLTLEEIQRDWDYLTRADVLVACWFIGTMGSRTWKKRWGDWAYTARPYLWESAKQDECPWPPTPPTDPTAERGQPWKA